MVILTSDTGSKNSNKRVLSGKLLLKSKKEKVEDTKLLISVENKEFLQSNQKNDKYHNSSKILTSKKANNLYKKYFKIGLYRPIKCKRILGGRIVDNDIILTYCNEKGDKMESSMDNLIKDSEYISLVFDFFNRNKNSKTSYFECGFHRDE